MPYQHKACLRALDKTIDFLTRQIEQLEAEPADIASAEFDKQLKALTSVKGIGVTLATALILTTGGFTHFDNAKQLPRFLGVCPTCQQSGTSLNIKGHINRNGDELFRSLLYMASWTALRYNTACRKCYLRLKANGKPSKVAPRSPTDSSDKHSLLLPPSQPISTGLSRLKINPCSFFYLFSCFSTQYVLARSARRFGWICKRVDFPGLLFGIMPKSKFEQIVRPKPKSLSCSRFHSKPLSGQPAIKKAGASTLRPFQLSANG